MGDAFGNRFSRRRMLGSAGAIAAGLTASKVGWAAVGAHPAGATTADVSAGQAAGPSARPMAEWQSSLVHLDDDGRLVYESDHEGNRIPDFGHAGYAYGEQPVPDVPTVRTIGPVDGDNTAHIQAALDAVGALPQDDNGIRGALLLEAGEYGCAGRLLVNRSGVVLRGVGDGDDPSTSTILRALGDDPHQRDFLTVGAGGATSWWTAVPGTRTDITSERVTVGSRTFEVADVGALSVGDNVVIVHPCTERWLAAVDYGGTATDAGWVVDEQPIVFNRWITAIDGDQVTVDVALFNHLDRGLSQSHVYVWDRANLVTDVGVERLRVDIAYDGDPDADENHAWNAIHVSGAEDFWLTGCTMLHFGLGGVWTTRATRGTVSHCRAVDPVSLIDGGRRYNFGLGSYSQQVLFRNCRASHARHAYVSNGTSSVSGVVFLRSSSEASLASSEGHRRWSQGMLWDNHTEIAPETSITLGIYNRGDYGTGHGWAAAHSVGWNCDLDGTRLVVQRPPTAQNYAIGCAGMVTGDGPFDQPAGFIEGTDQPALNPESLYEAQLADRRNG